MEHDSVYMHLGQQIRRQIQDGDLKPGDLLSITVICRDSGCARGTAAHALQVIEGEGLVERFPGMGYRVSGSGERDPRPYQRLAGQIRGAIRTGQLRAGELIVVRCLADAAGLSRYTAGKAMRLLGREGWVTRSGDWGMSSEIPAYRGTSRDIPVVRSPVPGRCARSPAMLRAMPDASLVNGRREPATRQRR